MRKEEDCQQVDRGDPSSAECCAQAEVGTLERAQQRDTNGVKGLEHLPHEKRLRELGYLAWRREGSGGFYQCL